MEIQIDVDLLVEEGISADDFTALYIFYRSGHALVMKMNLKPNWMELQNKGFVKLGASPLTHVVRQKFIDLFTSDFEKMFNELLLNSNLKAYKKYKKVVGTKLYTHKKIMRCLDTQLTIERDNLGYLQNLETWLNNHTWEKYTDIDESNDGEERITRKL